MTDRTTMLSEKDNVSAAEYSLGVMQGQARLNFARRIANEPALAQAVRQWDEQFATFAEDIAPEQPPRHVEAALQKRLFSNAQSKPSLWQSLGFWRGLTAASLAAAIALGALSLRSTVEQPSGNALVAQVAAEQGDLKIVAYYDEAKGELRLNRVAGAAHSGRSLELWLIAGNEAPVSLGVLADVAATHVKAPAHLLTKFKNGILAISDEPAGGSPTGAPTGAVLATGPLTEV